MLLLTLFITVLLTFTSGQTVGSEIDQKELVLIKDYKAFFLNTCERLEKNVTVPNYLKGWQEKFQNKKKLHFINSNTNQEVEVNIVTRPRSRVTLRYTFYRKAEPELFISTSKNCNVGISRLIRRHKDGAIYSISTLSKDLKIEKSIETVNPAVPAMEPTSGIRVALIDTGINYLLPEITRNLARNSPTQLLGYDFEDGDELPFDIDFVGSPFFPRHHGTSVASVLIKEAPLVQIVPYRFPRKDPCLFKEIIADIAKLNIKVALMPMGSNDSKTWKCFYNAAKKYKGTLYIVSAGNENLNIDTEKTFPASLPLKNMLVISSSTIFGNLAKGSNFGKKNVDLIVNAEQLRVIDHRGVKSIASGSSFAVPRIGAMVARFLQYNPEASVEEIIRVLKRRAIPHEGNLIRFGWIPDPLDNYLFHIDSK